MKPAATAAERAREIASLYVMTKAVMNDGLQRGFPPQSVRAVAATYCFCSRGGLDLFAAYEVMEAATYIAAQEWNGLTQ